MSTVFCRISRCFDSGFFYIIVNMKSYIKNYIIFSAEKKDV